ncbi:unnamed protein product [Calypogeia fissa]
MSFKNVFMMTIGSTKIDIQMTLKKTREEDQVFHSGAPKDSVRSRKESLIGELEKVSKTVLREDTMSRQIVHLCNCPMAVELGRKQQD